MTRAEIAEPRIAGVVVLHHPREDLGSNVASYADDVACLYVVDNSPLDSAGRLDSILRRPTVTYLPMSSNIGLAGALNIAVERAGQDGFDWLLTLDQDSVAKPGMVAEMLRCLAEEDDPSVALITPVRRGPCLRERTGTGHREQVDWAMTSGSLVRLDPCRRIGAFDADLFVDGVDHDYCLRLRKSGYRILRANRATLLHEPGEIDRLVLGRIPITNHAPERRYYMIRNRFVLARRHGVSRVLCCAVTLADAILITLFEQQKTAKLRMMLRGFGDYRRGRLGSLGETSADNPTLVSRFGSR